MRIPGFDTLSRIPVPAVVRAVLDPVLRPATAYVAAVPGKLDRLADQIIAEVLRRVDLDEAVRRVDVEAVLDRVDLTETVLRRVDLARVVDAVLDQMDLIALANEIIDGVDLPEIIRDSTGSMASETVKGVRMQGIEADQAVGRAVDRLLLRRSRTAGTVSS
jgi:hypothetical protein